MNVEQVTLDNGTTISYGIDEFGDPDFSALEIQTGHELVTIRPAITMNEFDLPVIRLEISDLQELADDDYDTESIFNGCEQCAGDIFEELIIG